VALYANSGCPPLAVGFSGLKFHDRARTEFGIAARLGRKSILKIGLFELAGKKHIGLVKGDMIVSASGAIPGLPLEMIELITRFDEFRPALQDLAAVDTAGIALADVHLLAPVQKPGKMLAIGLNYADHIAETGRETPKQQMWFTKVQSSVNGPFDPIQIPRVSPESVDYEVELVVVIGKGGRHISAADAPKAVFGYCVGNDVSVRSWQRHSPQWSIAKSFDTHSPMGPWITLADDMPDPHGHKITCSVNGEMRQESNTANLVFDIWAQIEYLSQAMTLEPGDVIFTGTPGGVGWVRGPEGLLKEGDTCRCEVEGLGFIEGRMVAE
jgi:2-keto-4-pentenoate hydratase/2-oxohepta-3-ene-1,7-dioic acid hydratase in catechol pathway